MAKIAVEYSSNNSGGGWWIKDKDWKNLEKAGWDVKWHKDKKSKWISADEDGRWLGALAGSASKDFSTIQNAIKEFEEITGQDVSDEGCNCCGPPHTFRWGDCAVGVCDCPERTPHKDYNWASGEDLLKYMFPEKSTNLSKRELLKRET